MDVVVTVPRGLWAGWVAEGDLPGQEAEYESHFWAAGPIPLVEPGDRVYIVSHGRLRGYAPLTRIEERCELRPSTRCLLRGGGAVAVTIDEPVRGFQGVRRRWWDRARERPYPDWATDGVPADMAARIARLLPAGSLSR